MFLAPDLYIIHILIFWKDFVLKSLLWYADDHHEAIQKLESSSGLFMVSRTLL